MRSLLVPISAVLIAAFAIPSSAQEHLLNCQLMDASSDPLFRQHCKAENFSRRAMQENVTVDDTWDDAKKHKDGKKHAYLKKRLYDKKHALLKKKEYLKKKLHTEWHECKDSKKCRLLVKRKLAKLHKNPGYSGMALGNTLGTTTSSALSSTTSTVGGLANTASSTLSNGTNTAGGLLK